MGSCFLTSIRNSKVITHRQLFTLEKNKWRSLFVDSYLILISLILITWENSAETSRRHHWFPLEMTSDSWTPFTRAKKNRHGTPNFWHRASFTLAETTPDGSLGTPKILSTGATLHLGPIRLHVENWECRALKSSAQCQKFGVPCDFFSACKWVWVTIAEIKLLMTYRAFQPR